MKKALGITLISVITVIAALGTFTSYVALNGICTEKYSEGGNSNWMKSIKDNALLTDVVIPGSHDSGTYGMPWVTETQTYSIKEQLNTGVRYFDIRVNKLSEDKYVTFHDISNGVDFEPILKDIKDFLLTNKEETLILDFQHFKNKAEDGVKTLIDQYLVNNNLVIKNETTNPDLKFVSELKVGDARGKCLIFFGDDINNPANYIFSRNNDTCTNQNTSLNSCYVSSYNKMSSKDYIEKGIPFYFTNIKNKIKNEGSKGIFVLQGQLTDGKLLFGPWSREKEHDKNMTDYITSTFINGSEELNLSNVIMRDFINNEKVNQIIKLNLEKHTCSEELLG